MESAAGVHWTLLVALFGAGPSEPPSPAASDRTTVRDEQWYEVVSQHPGPEVTDPTMHRSVEEGGHPWKVRGGDWNKSARSSRSAVRDQGGTSARSNRIGFRVARTR